MNLTAIFNFLLIPMYNIHSWFYVNNTLVEEIIIKTYDVVNLNGEDVYFPSLPIDKIIDDNIDDDVDNKNYVDQDDNDNIIHEYQENDYYESNDKSWE